MSTTPRDVIADAVEDALDWVSPSGAFLAADGILVALTATGYIIVPQQPTGDMLAMGEHFYNKTVCGLMSGDASPLHNAWAAMLDEVPK